jgi:DNA-directed RNA polymerase
MWLLYHVLREAFVLVHSENVLAEFRKSCSAVVVAHLLAKRPELDFEAAGELASQKLPVMPTMGGLKLGDVLSSDYFFA